MSGLDWAAVTATLNRAPLPREGRYGAAPELELVAALERGALMGARERTTDEGAADG